jgi:hypothetical protein
MKNFGCAELRDMDKGTTNGSATLLSKQMEDLCLEAVPVVTHTQMESLVITWWLLLSHPDLTA